MWRIRDEGISWRSLIVLACIFFPAAFLSGYIPGWWYWLAAPVLVVTMLVTVNLLARRDRQRLAKRDANPS